MPVINTRFVTGPLNNFTAAVGGADILDTALDRRDALQACAAIVNGLASAIATVDEKICPPNLFPSRQRLDRRWAKASTQLDDAALMAGRLGDVLKQAAARCPKAITDGEPVHYSGSQRDVHGRYVLRGYCSCRFECRDGIELYHGPQDTVLTCVNPYSIDPVSGPDRAKLQDAFTVGRILDAQPRTLPAPLAAEDAITIVRGLSAIASRARVVLLTWQDAFGTRLANRRCVVNPHGFDGTYFCRRILEDLDHIRPDLTQVRTHLRNAVAVMAEIEADPHTGRRAA